MTGITAVTIDAKTRTIEQDSLQNLQTLIRGKVITPFDSSYDETRKIWNDMIDRKPAFIVQCTGTADVIHAVLFAKQHQLLMSVRGAGHNIAGRSLADNVMMIDLSQMRTVLVNPDTKRIMVSPGATLGDVDHETQAFGLALPVGINSTTGVAGLTLGGGFGWLSRKYGMTVDSLLSAEVVLTSGECIRCDPENHADLFWALTGGGGNFGIVTQFEFKVHPVGPEVMAGPVIFDMQDAKNVLKNYREFCKNSPEELCIWAILRGAPPFPFIEPNMHGKPVLILVGMHCGSLEQGAAEFEKLKKLGNPLAHGVAPHNFVDFEQAFDPLLTPGARNYWKTHNYTELSDDLISTVTEWANQIPSPQSEIFIAQMGGYTNRVPQDKTAYPHRNVEFIMNVHTRWENASQDSECITWARDFYAATLPFATGGAYVNFVSEGDDNIESAYGENFDRLAQMKAKYDPDNRLRSNLNILPG